MLVVLAILGGWRLLYPLPAALTQWDIDNAVNYTLANTPPAPADTALAAAIIAPSVVRVDGYLSPEHAAQLAKAEADEERKNKHSKSDAPTKPKAPTTRRTARIIPIPTGSAEW